MFDAFPMSAQDAAMYPMAPPDEPAAILLGTGGVDGQTADESWFRQWGDPMARNISAATLTPFLADPETANGASVLVAPGGGFMWLSMGNEGWEVAEALAARGINAFVLKYRLQPTADTLEDFEVQMQRLFADAGNQTDNEDGAGGVHGPRWDYTNPLEDAEAAYAMIVANADQWGVDTGRIGMVGFSAGAALTLHTTFNSGRVDLAFIAPIYGPMVPVEVPADAPPLFVAIATDDFLFEGQFGLVKSWFDAGAPVEFHLYQNGGHGFGLGNPDRTSNAWFDAFIHWLNVNEFLEASR
ncbi:MAG: alpha/beta hydrolase [Hyphomonas sp.]